MQKRIIDAVAAIPGVESVGLADQVPLGDTRGLKCLQGQYVRSKAVKRRR